MKHSIFTTRLRTEEIIKEAVQIWKQSNQSEHLEGLEKDPVFSLIITALAYLANELEADISQLKEDVLEEFSHLLIPFEMTHAIPATAVLEARLESRILESPVTQNNVFILQNTDYSFIPLLKTRLLNGEVSSVVRLDNRRWKVGLQFIEPLESLEGMTFRISNPGFQDLKVFLNGHPLSLVKPWEYADLPFCDSFSIDNLIYSQSSVYNSTAAWADLFAKQNLRIFYIASDRKSRPQNPSSHLELTFEFSGNTEDFFLDKDSLTLNAIVVLNASRYELTLSSTSPIARIASGRQQFMHLLKPRDNQVLNEESVIFRRVGTDRFNKESLLRAINHLVFKYQTDYYAFQNIPALRDGKFMSEFSVFMKKVADGMEAQNKEPDNAFYVYLQNRSSADLAGKSLKVEYLMTDGAAVNDSLSEKSTFKVPAYSYIRSLDLVSRPLPGADAPKGPDALQNIAGYFMATGDRLVTPADIKIFCVNELFTRYSISKDMVVSIKVKNRRNTTRTGCGFETLVQILLKDDVYLRKSIENKLPFMELSFQKMIEVRSTNVFPVRITIEFNRQS